MQTRPYPWPYDHDQTRRMSLDRVAVMVCGWQQHWLDTIARPPSLSSAVAAIDALRFNGALVCWVRHGAPTMSRARPGVLPIVNTPSWELLTAPSPDDVVIDTPGFDAFLVEWTDLELRGRSRDRLVMCGLGTEGPVSASTRSANDRGYECLTATDLSAHHAEDTGAAQLSSICMSGGIFGAVGTAADLLAAVSRSQEEP